MRILFLSHNFYPFIGGIEIISDVLANAFTEAGHEVHLVTWQADSSNKNFPFTVIRNPGIIKLFKEHAWADLVFENNICLRLSWPGLFFGRPSVIGLQTWINKKKGNINLAYFLKMKWLNRARKVIACSYAIQKTCWPNAIVIGNPYRDNIFKILDKQESYGLVFLGRLVSDKGADLAIQALHSLLTKRIDHNPKIPLTIIGDGPERERLKNMVYEFGLQNDITFTGELSGKELVDCLNRHRFLLVPSRWKEPFGVVALEGMACGCLPVVSDGGGLPDAVGNAGVVFRRGDLSGLVSSISYLLVNPQFEEELRSAATKHLHAHSSNSVARRYLNIFESVI
jgi:glycosyltransferase involved in cell wall biosynthesis